MIVKGFWGLTTAILDDHGEPAPGLPAGFRFDLIWGFGRSRCGLDSLRSMGMILMTGSCGEVRVSGGEIGRAHV